MVSVEMSIDSLLGGVQEVELLRMLCVSINKSTKVGASWTASRTKGIYS